jgi:hypothetical protein
LPRKRSPGGEKYISNHAKYPIDAQFAEERQGKCTGTDDSQGPSFERRRRLGLRYEGEYETDETGAQSSIITLQDKTNLIPQSPSTRLAPKILFPHTR